MQRLQQPAGEGEGLCRKLARGVEGVLQVSSKDGGTMKALGMVMALVGVVVLGSGCVSGAQAARQLAAGDLRCPASRIQTEEVRAGWFRARGCGREAYYYDYNSYAESEASSTRSVARNGR
jgi:hypothetical protein